MGPSRGRSILPCGLFLSPSLPLPLSLLLSFYSCLCFFLCFSFPASIFLSLSLFLSLSVSLSLSLFFSPFLSTSLSLFLSFSISLSLPSFSLSLPSLHPSAFLQASPLAPVVPCPELGKSGARQRLQVFSLPFKLEEGRENRGGEKAEATPQGAFLLLPRCSLFLPPAFQSSEGSSPPSGAESEESCGDLDPNESAVLSKSPSQVHSMQG